MHGAYTVLFECCLRVGLRLHQLLASRMRILGLHMCPYSSTISVWAWSADLMMPDIAIKTIYLWEQWKQQSPTHWAEADPGWFPLSKIQKETPVPLNNPTGRKQEDIDECPSDEQVEAVSLWRTVSQSRPGGSVMLLCSGSSPARWQLMIKVTSVRFPKSLLTRSSPASLQPSPSVFSVSHSLRRLSHHREVGQEENSWTSGRRLQNKGTIIEHILIQTPREWKLF